MSIAYPIRSLIYVSDASPQLSPDDLEAIHHAAVTLNALDGVTGLLVYNGDRFMQIVEGAADAIEDLLQRLSRDPRHANLSVRSDQTVETKSFPDWSMSLLKVSAGRFEARDDLEPLLPPDVDASVRVKLLDALDLISR